MSEYVVLMKGGKSYINNPYGRALLVNGKSPEQCPGNSSWVMIDGPVLSISREMGGGRTHSGFALKPELVGVAAVPASLPVDAFVWDDDIEEWTGTHAELYSMAYVENAPIFVAEKFVIADLDCEPVTMPDYVHVDFPANLREYRQAHHKYPCRVPMEHVFRLVSAAVLEKVAKYPRLYHVNYYRNIGALDVDVIVTHEPKSERVQSNASSRRPKWKTVTTTKKNLRILSIVGNYKGSRSSSQIESVCGSDYADLQQKLAAYIKRFTDMIDERQWHECTHCGGEGFILGVTGG